MKIYIGPYKNHLNVYRIADTIFFWKKKSKYSVNEEDTIVDKFGDRLAKIGWLVNSLDWINGSFFMKRKKRVRIDNYDVWSMDHTLALIIVPMLKKLKDQKHGNPYIDDSDLPADVVAANITAGIDMNEIDSDVLDNRWNWVIDEMIWAFEQHADSSWNDQYHSGVIDMKFIKNDDGTIEMVKGPNDTYKVDNDGLKAHQERMANGRRLFAKYYDALWD